MKAVIFDFNGVIINDTSYHIKAWELIAKKYSLERFTEDYKRRIYGKSTETIARELFKQKPTEDEIARYAREKELMYMKLLGKDLPIAEGLSDFIGDLEKHAIKIAMATSSAREFAEKILRQAKLMEKFLAIVTVDDVRHPKPDPEIYLKAAQAIGENPLDCVAIEDTLLGIRSAKGSGMRAIGFVDTYSDKKLKEAGANFVISSFRNLTVENVTARL